MNRELEGLIREQADRVADAVTERFLREHPGWFATFGAAAALQARENHRSHLDFLASAVRYGRPEAYAAYAGWSAQVLESRGVSRPVLRLVLGMLEQDLGSVEALRPYFEAAGRACEPDAEASPPEPLDGAAATYLQALLVGDAAEAVQVAMAGAEGGGLLAAYELVERAQKELGRLWATAGVTVAEEHLATAVTQSVLGRLGERIEPRRRGLGIALVSGVQGELHQVGTQMVADVLAMEGWDVRFVGTDTPHDALVDLVRRLEPRLLTISVSMLATVPAVEELIGQVRRVAGPEELRILVGGRVMGMLPGLWREIGADGGGASLRDLLEASRAARPHIPKDAAAILVVDDEPSILRLAARVLERQGWQTIKAASGEEARQRISGVELRAAVLDVVLPDAPGTRLARLLRQERPGLPLLFMSGMSAPEDMPEDAAFVAKPFTVAGLTEGLRRAVEQASAPPAPAAP